MYQTSFANFRKNWLNSLILGLVCGFFLATLFLLNIVLGGIGTLLVLLLGLPFLFACLMVNRSLRYNGSVTFKSLYVFGLLFWRKPFSSTFRFWMSLLWTILVNVVVSAILAVICYFVFEREAHFVENIKALAEAVNNNASIDTINAIMARDNDQLYRYICSASVPGSAIQLVVFTHFILLEQPSMYHRARFPQLHPQAHRMIYKNAIRDYRGTFLKYYYGLNFPLFILLLGGAGLGAYIGYLLYGYSSGTMIGISHAGAILMASLYLPIVFHNQEAIYDEFEPLFKRAQSDLINAYNRQLHDLDGTIHVKEVKEEEIEEQDITKQ